MLLTNDDLLLRFKKLLASAARVDCASAWATEGPALTALRQAKEHAGSAFRLRAIVGVHGNCTTPSALDALNRIAELRIVDGVRLFHPKVYLFDRPGEHPLAWVGSANLTGMGFAGTDGNEEVILETRETRQIRDWFYRRWDEAGLLDERLLIKYRKRYKEPGKGWRDERRSQDRSSDCFVADGSPTTPPRDFKLPILQALRQMGGSGNRQDVLRQVHEIMKSRLHPSDEKEYAPNPSVFVWQQNTDIQRHKLQKKGLIKPGTWELTDKGKKQALSTE